MIQSNLEPFCPTSISVLHKCKKIQYQNEKGRKPPKAPNTDLTVAVVALLFTRSSHSYLLVPPQSVVRVRMEGRDGGEGAGYRARASRLNIYHDTCSVKRDMLQEPDEARRTVYQQHVCACACVRARARVCVCEIM